MFSKAIEIHRMYKKLLASFETDALSPKLRCCIHEEAKRIVNYKRIFSNVCD